MPAMLDDPTGPTIYRVTGTMPPEQPGQPLPHSISPRQVMLRDRTTMATLMPIGPGDHVPPRLVSFLCELLNNEIRLGDTYPMMSELPIESFRSYWFQNFAAVMLLGDVGSVEDLAQFENQGVDWKERCMGSFYIKPNYPGRSSHICNGGFLVSNASRNRGVGKLMGEGYLDWAPKLGYVYSVFNLVYETNHASIRIWDSLGFKRIGRVKGCGKLKSFPGQLTDAIIYGRDLGPESEDLVSEERFDKIRYYLKHQKYPVGADRAEKSRLRSAATHYHLAPGAPGEEEKLMLKDKEVIADQNKQYEIARQMHGQSHGGINKTTATIAEKYHWVRIKETVSLVIKNCTECKENNKVPTGFAGKDVPSNGHIASKTPPKLPLPGSASMDGTSTPPQAVQLRPQPQTMSSFDQSMPPSMGSTPSISRDVSATRQSPLHQQTSTNGPTSMPMPPQNIMPARTLQQAPPHALPGQMSQQQPHQNHVPQSIIPPHINNHLGMTMTSTHGTPAGSAVHSPLPNGPASAPISNMQQPFDLGPLDPILQQMHHQYGHQDLSGQSLDDPMQGMSHLEMDTNMQDLSDLNAMGLGDASVHGLGHSQLGQTGPHGGGMGLDHNHMGQAGGQAGGLSLDGLTQQHGGPPDGLLSHHNPHGHTSIKHEIPDFNTDNMMLDGNLDLSKANMG